MTFWDLFLIFIGAFTLVVAGGVVVLVSASMFLTHLLDRLDGE